MKGMMKKTLWLVTMVLLTGVLFFAINSRTDKYSDVVFGGVDGTFVSGDQASFSAANVQSTPEPTPDIWPKIDINESRLYSIISEDNTLSSAYDPDISLIPGNNVMFATDAMPYLEAMIQAAKDAGFTVYIHKAYVTYSYQNRIFNSAAWGIAVEMGIDDYNDPEYQKAAEKAKKSVKAAGTDEHQLGYAIDLMDKHYTYLNYENMNQDFYEWLDAHCADYGFIKRFPTKKLLITGWDEPWHYRYVGVEAAKFIMEQGICLEEFYAHYDSEYKY